MYPSSGIQEDITPDEVHRNRQNAIKFWCVFHQVYVPQTVKNISGGIYSDDDLM
jgi:hypothetical protein